MKILILLASLSLLFCCQSTNVKQGKQGIIGKVLWLEGNFMPSPDQSPKKGKPVVREIMIHKLTNVKDASREGAFFKDIQSEHVTTVKSNENGEFKVDLSVGEYSVFTKEEKGFFANGFDTQNNINKVVVSEGQYESIVLKIDYMAAY